MKLKYIGQPQFGFELNHVYEVDWYREPPRVYLNVKATYDYTSNLEVDLHTVRSNVNSIMKIFEEVEL